MLEIIKTYVVLEIIAKKMMLRTSTNWRVDWIQFFWILHHHYHKFFRVRDCRLVITPAQILTISLLHNFMCSLSSLVFPVPGPVIDESIIVTYFPQPVDRSSSTCFNTVSTLLSHASIAECTSLRPSSWKRFS